MCLPVAGTAAAAQLAQTMSVIGTVTSAVGTAAGIMQAQQQASFARQQASLQIQQQRQQAEISNQNLANQYASETAAQQAQRRAYENNLLNNQTAANKGYQQEQTKLQEARAKAAFKSQEIYAKSIGVKGSVLATGATGQSVGLLALDADRQAGFGLAQQDAAVQSAARQAEVASDLVSTQQTSQNNQAYSSLAVPVAHPTFAPSPGGGPISAPTYNWFD